MVIFLSILGFLALLITVILLSPVRVIFKNDAENSLILRYRLFFMTFGEDPNPNDPIVRMLKTATGAERLEKKHIQKDGLKKTVSDNYDMLKGMLKELLGLLKRGKLTRLHITIRCADEGADSAAIQYGLCCAATYGFLELLRNFIRIRRRGQKINIYCDFQENKSLFRYDGEITVRFFRVLAALWRVAMAEARRLDAQKKSQQK